MRSRILAAVAVFMAGPALLVAQLPPAEEQVAAALNAAPVEQRAGATVLGYDDQGRIVTLREGSNELVCLGDDPGDDRFSVACYHESLEPYMARGRQLSAQGVTGSERNEIRWREAEEGSLSMPEDPATLYVLSDGAFSPATGVVEGGRVRWVLYVPYATRESIGLRTDPAPGVPWLMFPGTPGAHIMITPPR